MVKSLSASFSENYTDSISQHSCKLRTLSVTMVISSSHTEKLLLERSAEIKPRTYTVDMVREEHILDWSPRRSGGFAITVFLSAY